MNINLNRTGKLIWIYILQVGAFWGLIGAYSYFKGDELKNLLGPFWILIYIIPILTTGLVFWREEVVREKKLEEARNEAEKIRTKGIGSPGKVGRNYSVRRTQSSTSNSSQQPSQKQAPLPETSQQPTANVKREISTEGDYSPGEVGGDYDVEL